MTIHGSFKSHVPVKLGNSNLAIGDPNYSNLRVYQAWKGNNKFCFGGRLVFGPDLRSIFLTVSLILIPVILFCAFVSKRLIHEFQQLGNLILAICIIYTIYVIFLLLLTSGRDPGIIPRSLNPPDSIDDECDLSTLSSEWPGSYTGSSLSVRPTKDVVVNGIIVRVKYCHTCRLYRPPRCSHCSVCNNCVERFDHHCPWVGQCIGKYAVLAGVIGSLSLNFLTHYGVIYFLCRGITDVKKIMDMYHCGLLRAFGKSPVSVILILYTFIAAWFVGGLTAFHLYLITSNQTTYENFRYRYDRKRNPYNRGCMRNIGGIFFSRIPRSKNNFREKMKPADSSSVFSVSPKLSKKSADLEMGKQRQAVTAEEFEVKNYADIVSRVERCDTEPRHSNWDSKPNWATQPDMSIFARDFNTKSELSEKKNDTTVEALAQEAQTMLKEMFFFFFITEIRLDNLVTWMRFDSIRIGEFWGIQVVKVLSMVNNVEEHWRRKMYILLFPIPTQT